MSIGFFETLCRLCKHRNGFGCAAFPKRMGRPEEYGKLAVAIVENAMLNGQCIRLDAGQRFAPK